MKRHSAHVMREGEPQTWIGVNYWSASGGPLMWRHYDPDLVSRELAQLRDHGITVTRSFLYWPDFHPEPDRLDAVMLDRLADFLDRHAQAGMMTIPSFIVGHMSGENWDPVWRNGRDIFQDVWFVGRQAWYVREVVARFATHPAIAGWLLSNEIPIYGDWKSRGIGTIDSDAVTAWAQILIDAIRAAGGTQPVSVGEGAWGIEITGEENGFRVRALAALIDFFGPHVYRMETDLVRQHLGGAFICELLDIGGKPVVMEEFGLTDDYVDRENAAHYYRQMLHQTLLAGATGWIAWNNVDYDPLWEQRPYSHHPFELHFGLIDAAGRAKEQLIEVRNFARLLEQIDGARLHREDTALAILVSSHLENEYPFTHPLDGPTIIATTRQAYVAAREADLAIGVVREADGIPEDLDLIIVPATKALLAGTWRDLVAQAEAGATVYASYFNGAHANQRGSWWPDLNAMFGVRKTLRYGLIEPVESDHITVTFVADLGDITAGTELRFQVAGSEDGRSRLPVTPREAEVLAIDQDGNPALVRRRVGSGSMVLACYPLEYFAASARDVNPEPTSRLYAALAQDAGHLPAVRVADPRVLVAAMVHEDGTRYVWFTSQHDGGVTIEPRLTSGSLVTLTGEPVTQVSLAPFGVEVLRHLR